MSVRNEFINASSLSFQSDSLTHLLGATFRPRMEIETDRQMDRQIKCYGGNSPSYVSCPQPDCLFKRFLPRSTVSKTSNDLKFELLPDLIINVDRGTHNNNLLSTKIIDLYSEMHMLNDRNRLGCIYTISSR
jgi:hypothetical protein